jgi:hypothetical protein
MPTLAHDYLNASGRRLRRQNILTVVNSRVRLQINGMWVPKWGVMANLEWLLAAPKRLLKLDGYTEIRILVW